MKWQGTVPILLKRTLFTLRGWVVPPLSGKGGCVHLLHPHMAHNWEEQWADVGVWPSSVSESMKHGSTFN